MTTFNQTAGFTITQLQTQILEEEIAKILTALREKLIAALKEDTRHEKTTHTVYINASDYKSETVFIECIAIVEQRLLAAQGTAGTPGEWTLQPVKRMQGTYYFVFNLNPPAA